MEFSLFGTKLASRSGILELMDDLGQALGGPHKKYMLGGGNPAHIPEINGLWREGLGEMAEAPGKMESLLANYDEPAGPLGFRAALANLLKKEYGWDLGAENIALTNGSQNAFFLLFNLFAGEFSSGVKKKILFPLAPEYIGYADQALGADSFISHSPKLELEGSHQFKYRVDFDTLPLGPEIGALCASRPTNPSGNVLTDQEVEKLAEIARERDIPFLLDSAYGAPFPGILFAPARPFWTPSVVLVLSLSKLGLPGTRTGIIIARPEIIRAVTSVHAVINLAGGNLGPALVQPLVEDGRILSLSRNVLGPYYKNRMEQTVEFLRSCFGERFPWRIHRPEGALFLWIWFPGMKISSRELYRRLKTRDTVIVPGHFFFFGSDQGDPGDHHSRECIRITYSQNRADVEAGLEIIAEEVEKGFQEGL